MENREIKVLVRGKSETATRIAVAAGKFSMTIDEPETMGGTDAGPSPIQVLLMSLAGCLSISGPLPQTSCPLRFPVRVTQVL